MLIKKVINKCYEVNNRQFIGNRWEVFLAILSTISVCITMVFYIRSVIGENPEIKTFFFVPCITCVGMSLLFAINRYQDGNALKGNELYYYKNYKQYQIRYSEIDNIIISNAWGLHQSVQLGKWKRRSGRIRFVQYPWLTLMESEAQQYMNGIYQEGLRNRDVDRISKDKGYIYSFVWRETDIEKLLTQFTGNYYIAASVYQRFEKEIHILAEKYKIASDRLLIIQDCPGSRC